MANLFIKRVITLPVELTASTMYIVKADDADHAEIYFTSEDGLNVRRVVTQSDVSTAVANALDTIQTISPSQAEALVFGAVADKITAAQAETMYTAADSALETKIVSGGVNKLVTARSISATGDGTWSVTFDGSNDATAALTLANSGVTAGTYSKVTVDGKGRVTSGATLVADDIPSIPSTKVSGTVASATVAAKLATPAKINGVDFDGSADITIQATDSVARIAVTEKGTSNGVATLDANGKVSSTQLPDFIPSAQKGAANGLATLDVNGQVPASQLPSYVDDVVEVANVAALPVTGEASKIYVTTDDGMVHRWSGTQYIQIPTGTGLADQALRFKTARTIALAGDVAGSVSFDGSADVEASVQLAEVFPSGSCPLMTVDAKGRVRSMRAIQEGDLPLLNEVTVTAAASVALAVAEW